MAKKLNNAETIIPMDSKEFTNISEQMVLNSTITSMRIIVEFVGIINCWNPWKNGDFNKVKKEIIKLAICN